MSALSLIIHLIACASYTYTIYYDYNHINIPNREKDVGRWKYLTHWNLILQYAFSILSVINDVFGSNSKKRNERSILQVIRDDLFNAVVFPASMFVSLTFWTLYLIDRELIFPSSLDPYFPQWMNHLMHTSVLGWLLIDLAISNHLKSCHKKSLIICFVFCSAYLVVINFIRYQFGFWVYPVLAVLSWPLKFLFMGCCYFSFFLFYYICNSITTCVCKEEVVDKRKKKH